MTDKVFQLPETVTDPATLPNHFFDTLLGKPVLEKTDDFKFACRSCGGADSCCMDKDILITPPEAIRMVWELQRQEIADKMPPFLEVFVGGSSGLPLAMLAFRSMDEHTVCPFLCPVVIKGEPTDILWCGIRNGRPGPCRTYPLGRAMMIDPETHQIETQYVLTTVCAGFEQPKEGQIIPPGYQFPSGQTVEQWIASQVLPEADREKEFYLEVVEAFMKAHLHAKTPNCPEGVFSERFVMGVLARIFYSSFPPKPDDPKDEHGVIMTWLRMLMSLPERFLARHPLGSATSTPETVGQPSDLKSPVESEEARYKEGVA